MLRSKPVGSSGKHCNNGDGQVVHENLLGYLSMSVATMCLPPRPDHGHCTKYMYDYISLSIASTVKHGHRIQFLVSHTAFTQSCPAVRCSPCPHVIARGPESRTHSRYLSCSNSPNSLPAIPIRATFVNTNSKQPECLELCTSDSWTYLLSSATTSTSTRSAKWSAWRGRRHAIPTATFTHRRPAYHSSTNNSIARPSGSTGADRYSK